MPAHSCHAGSECCARKEAAMSKVDIFLSHKVKDGTIAKQIQQALVAILPNLNVFLSEEITKSDDFRRKIWSALGEARFFILLFTDPREDWSWCFFEVGAYRSAFREERNNHRPIYCLHPKESPPPSPLSDLQTVKAEAADIERWLHDLCKLLRRRISAARRKDTASAIESAAKTRSILEEITIKPYLWITPRWPLTTPANFNAADLPEIPLDDATIEIDTVSATKLGFTDVPDDLRLKRLLTMLDCDSANVRVGEPYWITRFYASLGKAIRNNLLLQEVAYFRHESGSIYRPIIASVSKSRDGALCKLKVLFIQAFSAPLANQPSALQRLADGVRLGVRTRIEVINGFSGQLERTFQERMASQADSDYIARNFPVGRRVVEVLETITEEARAHGIRTEDPPPNLFASRSDQRAYERIRSDSIRLWEQLRSEAAAEDRARNGSYRETERLLTKLGELNDKYLRLALPRLNELMASEAADDRLLGVPPTFAADNVTSRLIQSD
jgi:hypothetical protein